MGRLPVIRRTAVLLAAALLGLGSAAAPAWAHEALVASEPAAGAVLIAAPPYLRLTFSGDVVDAAPSVVLRDGAGGDVPAGQPRVDGPTVLLPIEQQLSNGGYAVEWRIVSSDGDPVSGSFAFTVEAPVAATPAPVPSPAAGPPVPEANSRAMYGIDDHMQDIGNPAGGPWLAVGAAVLAVGLGVLAVRRRRRPDR